uniref:Putative small GTP-binding protein Rab28 n=1 Tax=Trypanosoma congolense (strain IL3000) TaxID=1068625 RepID=G0UNQ4_TRYCI|nr:putative small GTP-binding protein Rab28 [Trypanosoma congolense IL3000]
MGSESSDSDVSTSVFKILVLGNGGVGKTSLIRRYCSAEFAGTYKQTIGVDFFSNKVELPGRREVTLEIWDVGGQQTGGAMIDSYVMGASAIFLVYDVTSRESFNGIEHWNACVNESLARQAKEHVEGEGEPLVPLIVLVGNKSDLPGRQISSAEHRSIADSHQMESCIVSALSGERVKKLFMHLAAMLCGVRLPEEVFCAEDPIVANVGVGLDVTPAATGKNSACVAKKKRHCEMM